MPDAPKIIPLLLMTAVAGCTSAPAPSRRPPASAAPMPGQSIMAAWSALRARGGADYIAECGDQ